MKALLLSILVATSSAHAITIATNGKSACVIVQAKDASVPEQRALAELTNFLSRITGASFQVVAGEPAPGQPAIYVGAALARKRFADVPFDKLGAEELVIRTQGSDLLLAGGAPRGTLYAVSRFLQQQCGVRWWTLWASHVPSTPNLQADGLSIREKPAFEYREPFWMPAFDARWAVRNLCNGQSANIPNELGGCIRYKGFVHTFYPLVSTTNFAPHPEWFSMIKGKRTTEHGQLCLTNPKLRDYVVERVKQWLKESPEAGIVSVSQNDWHGQCQCESCKAVDDREGSHAGTMIEFVNYIAEKIEPEFPHVAVDTLAYQYTRKPPKTAKPRPNVIVRLCSIECNFREPLAAAANASFGDDIRGWSKICDRLYIWDYTTDFAHYVQPHPNWFVLGENLRFFQQHNVRGMFEQGAYQSHGSEMSEMRAWVLAQLLWNPKQDERALVREFINGYYGTNAAIPILAYFDLLHEASKGHNLTCYSATDAPFLRLKTLGEAEKLWQQAEKAAANPEVLRRVRIAHLPLRYVFLQRWQALRKECVEAKGEWPLAESRKKVADEFAEVAKGDGTNAWTKVTLLSEGGLTTEKFLARFAEDPK